MDFTAIDFETANASRSSVCSVGLVRVENGEVVKSVHTLIKPDSAFNFYNTVVHGITAFDVRNAPSFSDFWDTMSPYLSDTVVAHNASFDIACLRESVLQYRLPINDFEYLCTLSLSRRVTKFPSHNLSNLAKYYRLGDFKHHNALEDAKMCAKLFQLLAEKIDVSNFKKKFLDDKKAKPRAAKIITKEKHLGAFPNTINPVPKKTSTDGHKAKIKHSANLSNLNFDYSPIDFSKNFVVAGNFNSLNRRDVEGLILRNGGNVQKQISASTDYLVIGSIPTPEMERGNYGQEIDAALESERIRLVSETHLLKEIY